MAKQTRAPALRGRTTQLAQRANRKKSRIKRRKQNTASKTTQKSDFAQTRQASLTRRRVYTPELLDYVRRRFEQTEDSMADIGQDLGISNEAVRRLATRELETLRAAATWAAPGLPGCPLRSDGRRR